MADEEDLKLLHSGELDLSRCDFRGADLGGLDLKERDFTDSLFEKANCEGARFSGSNFAGARVSFMKARGAKIDDCSLINLHFGYTDLSEASFKNANAQKASFQHANLESAILLGANFSNGAIDADTRLEGAVYDSSTNFEGLAVLRATSRNPIFIDYRFEKGLLKRKTADENSAEGEKAKPAQPPNAHVPSRVSISGRGSDETLNSTKKHIQSLLRNALVTRVTAHQFADQIEETLREVPATEGNHLVEPLQTMLEFAEVLRSLAPAAETPTAPLDRGNVEQRIAELESLVEQLTQQLSEEAEARKTAEALANSDGFLSNFRQSAGKASGIAAVGLFSSMLVAGVPAAAIHFLGAENPLVATLLSTVSPSR